MSGPGFIAGGYTGLYKAASIGQVSAGFTIEHRVLKRLITGDRHGPNTPQDAVFQGHEVFVEFTLMEYNATGAGALFWPYGTLGAAPNVGRLDVNNSGSPDIAGALQLDANQSTPANNKPDRIVCPLAILADGFPVEILLAPDLRDIPLRLRLYPKDVGGGVHRFFEITDVV